MTRIVAGTAGGRTLKVPPAGTRPTSERVREALFSRLDHLGVVRGARVLDLYAGSGALGLEAASRGAAEVVAVEAAKAAAALCRSNAAQVGLADRVRVVATRVERYLDGGPPGAPFDLVLVDPPYDVGGLDEVLAALTGPGWLAPGALVVVEQARRSGEPTWPEGLAPDGEKTYGDTTLWFATTAGLTR
ncbi:16S rRNA (guanine(966)-N(2))-methyltransferase RsmD [Occultella gossypii]|uniref:16S rRNA (Guanine(966)-N(2))-methyltransferase RsmD n=1 Tax=Occultella gossypii TaxID=2800820 RepID=A0ABS7SH34_9MICO|nr:16S rRNA (guanine(966)-N(2))-methyltransferase RsmD [Occultella gossypii]MBZ2198563.1 16S rRNA (guanine(966)-N(2))-methyltransferase RsmD [Occultella gossypii]